MKGRRTLLVVEDDSAIRGAIAALLRDEGYSVAAVGDVRSALLVLQRHDVTAAILDWRLLDETAEPILAYLAGATSSTAVVLVSAAAECAVSAARFNVPFVKKPLDLDQLPDVISSAIRDERVPRSP